MKKAALKSQQSASAITIFDLFFTNKIKFLLLEVEQSTGGKNFTKYWYQIPGSGNVLF